VSEANTDNLNDCLYWLNYNKKLRVII